MKADYSRFNLKDSWWVPSEAPNSPREERLMREHREAVLKQREAVLAAIRARNEAALSTPLLAALWSFFKKQGGGWYADQNLTEVIFEGEFDLKDLAAAIEEALK